jgi:hypothetical protein
MALQNKEPTHTRERDVRLNTTTPLAHRAGPSLGIAAAVYVVLHLASIVLVSNFNPSLRPSFPAPDAAASTIVAFFQGHPDLVRTATFFQFGAGIALGIFAVGGALRLRGLGASAGWVNIALLSGLMTALDIAAASHVLWAMTWPGIAHNTPLTLALYYLQYAFGGPGYSVPMGLFVAGVSIAASSMNLLPKWIIWSGFLIAAIGVVSCLNLLLPVTNPIPLLIPLTRFPAFVWLIAAGFALPKTSTSSNRRR